METEWAAAAFPVDHIVFRLRMRPYCCGHEILLSRIASPIVCGGSVDWMDVFMAVLICSQTFESGLSTIRSPRRLKLLARIWKPILSWRLNIQFELAAFRAYLKSSIWSPKTAIPIARDAGIRELKAPQAYRMVPFLCFNLGLTESEALNFPISRACAYYAAIADRAGEIDLEGKNDAKIADRLAELERAEARGENPWDF